MPKKLPRGVSHYSDRHGKIRWRFRAKGLPQSQTRAAFGSPEWWAWYSAAADGQAAPRQLGAERTRPGSFSALIVAYYGSADFKSLSGSTQATYRGIIERFRTGYGDLPVAQLQAKHVRAMLDGKASTPAAANNLLRILRLLSRFAIERGWRTDDPTYAVRKVRSRSEGFHSWTEEEIAAFEAKHPLGSRARLAMALLLYSGQRRSDVVTMGRQHMRNGKLLVRQQKTSTRLTIPVHRALQAALDAAPATNLTFLVTGQGRPFSAAGFGNWFREMCNEAGLPQCSAHGLRKAAARRLAEAGCTPHQIMAVTGHKSLKEVVLYTAAANQERLADEALGSVEKDEKGTFVG